MEDNRSVPKEVMDKAIESGNNTVKYLGLYNDYEVWSLYEIDEDGFAVPKGLPFLILYKDNVLKCVNAQKVFALLDAMGI